MIVELIDRCNDAKLEATIKEVAEDDYRLIREKLDFVFDWDLERYQTVYKIFLASASDDFLGLMSIIDYKTETRIHINLIEVTTKHRGRNKQIDHIAACLIAFAARLSFKAGYGGIITLEPKPKLFELYEQKYGFQEIGYLMMSSSENAAFLMNKYLKDE